MAEIGKGVTAGKLAINVQKKFTRAQEKVLQKLGKADETRDAAFEEIVSNFNKQMMEGTKLQKDLKAYLVAVKTMHEASRRLQDCLADLYEPDWFGKEEVDAMAEEMIEKEMDNNLEDTDELWTDYHQNVTDNSMISMDTYLAQFPEIKARIAKRDRKMVDFDSARHHFASLQKGKKKDEAKIAKPAALLEKAAPSWAQGLISAHQVAQTNLSMNQAEEELGRAQKVFEELNVELQDELPVLYDGRVGLYVNTFQGMAGYQEKFHREMGKLSQNLNDIMTKLNEQRLAKKCGERAGMTEETGSSEGANHSKTPDSPPKRPGAPSGPAPGPAPGRPPPRLSPSPARRRDSDDCRAGEAPGAGPAAPQQDKSFAAQDPHRYDDQHAAQETPGDWGDGGDSGDGGDDSARAPPGHAQPDWDDAGRAEAPEARSASGTPAAQSYAQPGWDDDGAQEGQGGWGDAGGAQSAVTNGSDGEMPPGFVYKVKAVHDYAATDGDELELKAGDMVLVLGFDNPDEQDDGWLLGVKESLWLENRDISTKGVFPENFTQKV